MEFQNKVAIVTGGAQGIGFAFCSRLLKEGMKVCMCDIQQTSENFETLSNDYGDKIIYKNCDVTSASSLKEAFDKTKEAYGQIDLVVNNAGTINEQDWRKSIEVNIVGVINGIQLGFEYMGIHNGGSGGYIVNTGSNMAFDTFELAPIYGGTKHAVVGMTKNYGTDFHFNKTGVKVLCLCPGPVITPLFYKSVDFTLDPEEGKKLIASVKTVDPDAIAVGLIKLLKDGQNGAVLRVQYEFTKYVE